MSFAICSGSLVSSYSTFQGHYDLTSFFYSGPIALLSSIRTGQDAYTFYFMIASGALTYSTYSGSMSTTSVFSILSSNVLISSLSLKAGGDMSSY